MAQALVECVVLLCHLAACWCCVLLVESGQSRGLATYVGTNVDWGHRFFVLYIPLYKTGGRQEKKKWPVGYSVALIVWEIIWLIFILMLKYLGFRGLQYLLIWTFVGVVLIIVSFIADIEK